jgi:hypothetical protein
VLDELRALMRENGEAIAAIGFVLFALAMWGQAARMWFGSWRLARKRPKNLPKTEDDR